MKRILVPTDFSPSAEKAFRFALDLAARSKGTITLYHVYTPLESQFIDVELKRKQYNTQVEGDLLKKLQRLKKKVAGDTSEVEVSTIVGRSPLIDNILGFAEDHRVDLIVMGTQGASGIKKTLIGSVSARIVEESDTPVLLVPEEYELSAPREFVFATRSLKTDKSALAIIGEMATLYNAEIKVLHFQSTSVPHAEREDAKIDFDTYAYYLKREQNKYNFSFHLLDVDSIRQALETLDKKLPYDVMVMVKTKRSFLEKLFVKSFTKNMAYVTKKPLLVIPQ